MFRLFCGKYITDFREAGFFDFSIPIWVYTADVICYNGIGNI